MPSSIPFLTSSLASSWRRINMSMTKMSLIRLTIPWRRRWWWQLRWLPRGQGRAGFRRCRACSSFQCMLRNIQRRWRPESRHQWWSKSRMYSGRFRQENPGTGTSWPECKPRFRSRQFPSKRRRSWSGTRRTSASCRRHPWWLFCLVTWKCKHKLLKLWERKH